MSNPYYERVLNITPNTVARSAAVLSEFDVVEVAFDTLNNDAISPLLERFDFDNNELVLTGDVDLSGASSVKVPTVSVTDPDQTKAVNLAVATSLIGTSGTLIPPYSLAAGKALLSYGDHYGWGYVVPAPTGNGLKVPRVNASGTAYELTAITGGLTNGGVAAHSGTTVADQRTVLDIGASVAGTLVSLPDATTLPVGVSYLLSSRSGTNTAGLLDAAGNILTVANSSTGVAAILTDNSTAAGTWKLLSSSLTLSDPLTTFQQIRAGAVNVSTSPSQNVKFLLPIGGNDFLLASGESGGHVVRLRWLRADGLQISEIANATLTSAGTAVNRIEILRTASGSYVLLRRCAGSNATHATAFTLAGSAITTGATVDLMSLPNNNNPATAGQFALAWSAAVNGDKVLLLGWGVGTPSLAMVALSVSGTTITLGTKVDIRATGSSYSYGSVAACVEADKWLVAYGTDVTTAGAYTFVATASGLTLTQGTEQLINSTCGAVAVAVASSTQAWVLHTRKNNNAPLVYPITITGNTLAVGAGAGYGGPLNSTHPDVLGAAIELFPGNVVLLQAFCDTSTANANVLSYGSVASGAYVAAGTLGVGVTTYNQYPAINRLGDLGVAMAIGVVDSHVYLIRPGGAYEQMLSFVQVAHVLGANAKNSSVILLPGNRLALVNEATGTNTAVYAAKIGGF